MSDHIVTAPLSRRPAQMANPSPLGFHYRWNPQAECLEAAYVEHPDDFSALRVPGIQWMASVAGELEAVIAARDAAVTAVLEPELVGVVDLARVPTPTGAHQ